MEKQLVYPVIIGASDALRRDALVSSISDESVCSLVAAATESDGANYGNASSLSRTPVSLSTPTRTLSASSAMDLSWC